MGLQSQLSTAPIDSRGCGFTLQLGLQKAPLPIPPCSVLTFPPGVGARRHWRSPNWRACCAFSSTVVSPPSQSAGKRIVTGD